MAVPATRIRNRLSASRHRRADEIIEAAARIFAERGYHGANTQDIADVLGMKQASLYYYFSSKEAALELVCAHGLENCIATARQIASGDGSPTQKLSRLIEAHLMPQGNFSDFLRVFFNERHHLAPRTRKRLNKVAHDYETVVQQVIAQGVEGGELRSDLDPRLTVLGLLGMMNTVTAWYGREPGVDMRRIVDEFSKIFLQGVLSGAPAAVQRGRPGRRRAPAG